MSKTYCGTKKTPKGKTKGDLKECAKKSQVRLYGLEKVDKKELEEIQKQNKNKMSQSNLRTKIIKLNARLKKTIRHGKEARKKKDDEKADKKKEEALKLIEELRELEKLIDNK